ncbi:hypothetical protein ABZ357_18485 [Streptomyces sp. NPDC005917]|uniref:hypothetical protein n=1 Tax=unclassified Streptomyces TaxID=2593676 RepID=UPI0033F07D15
MAPPGISDADRERWIAALTALHASRQWRAALRRHGWTDAFAVGDTFGTFLSEQDTSVARLVTSLGLN